MQFFTLYIDYSCSCKGSIEVTTEIDTSYYSLTYTIKHADEEVDLGQ